MKTNNNIYKLDILSPKRQTHWRWPAVANFVLGGAGAGLYIISYSKSVLENKPQSISQIDIVASLLILSGLLALSIEVGRPGRSLLVIKNIKDSWISREVLFFVIFVIAIVFEMVMNLWVFRLIALIVAFLFMVSHGFILYSSRAVSNWNNPVAVLFFISSGLVSGCAVALLSGVLGWISIEKDFLFLVILLVFFNLLIWIYLLKVADKTSDPGILLEKIKRPFSITAIFSLLSMLALLISIKRFSSGPIYTNTIIIAAICMLSAIILQKAFLLLSLGFIRGVQMRFAQTVNHSV